MKDIKNNDEFLKIKLPHRFPIKTLYDDILKKQQRSTVNLNDKKVIYYLAQVISFLREINRIFNKVKI